MVRAVSVLFFVGLLAVAGVMMGLFGAMMTDANARNGSGVVGTQLPPKPVTIGTTMFPPWF